MTEEEIIAIWNSIPSQGDPTGKKFAVKFAREILDFSWPFRFTFGIYFGGNMLDTEEVRDLIAGKLKYRKCPCCDNNGLEYWDGETGLGASPSPSGINPEWLTWGSCENCNGLAYILYY